VKNKKSAPLRIKSLIRLTPKFETSYLSDNLDIGCARSIIWSNSIHDTDNVALHHANVLMMAIPMSHVEEVLDEIHDIGSHVHIVLFVLMSAQLDSEG